MALWNIFFFFLCSTFLVAQSDPVFSVLQYGAVGDGKTDDSQAFTKAWTDTCAAGGDIPTLLIPSGKTFLLKPITFTGPCTSANVHIQVLGDLVGPSTRGEWGQAAEWLSFKYIKNLTVDGTSRVGGQGSIWWPCKNGTQKCRGTAPTAMYFGFCDGLHMSGLHLHDNPRNHINLLACSGAVLHHVTITAPADSPNTDGINMGFMSHVQIYNSTIATGDDCITVLNSTYNVNISYITCGPGHGISIGSLGEGGSLAQVGNVIVQHCTFSQTTNALRIKTWQGGSGSVTGISFTDTVLNSVENAISIDQFYPKLKDAGSDVRVSNVTYSGVHGTVTTPVAIDLQCSDGDGCRNIVMSDVKITSAVPGMEVTSSCRNAHGPPCPSCVPAIPCLGKGNTH